MKNEQSQLLHGKKILVVEDEELLREAISDELQQSGCEVRVAANGLDAKTLLDLNKDFFDLVLTDVRMPKMDGIALLKHGKTQCPKTQFIIFTGFSEILEAQEAARLGASAFLAKPFRIHELTTAIEQCLGGTQEAPLTEIEILEAEKNFCKVKVEEFFSSTRLPSDIYVRVAPSKFVKVAKEDSGIEVSRLHTYKDRKVDFFFVKASDFHKYTGLNLKLAKSVVDSNRVSPSQKVQLFQNTSKALLQQIFVAGLDQEACDEASLLVHNTLHVVCENEDLFEMIVVLQGQGDHLYAHSLGVAVYSCMIARKMGWVSMTSHHKLMLAGIFHNIGLKEIPEELHSKPRLQMTADELKLYESHPARSRDLLLSMPGFPDELAAIVSQHHETMIGSGFPLRLSGHRIHPLARVLRLADELAEKILASPHPSIATARDILANLYQGRNEEFDPDVMLGAFDLLDLPRLPGMRRKAAV